MSISLTSKQSARLDWITQKLQALDPTQPVTV